MSQFFDPLEHRSAIERDAWLAEALPKQLAHAKANTPWFAESLKDVDVHGITSREALASLPIIRKHDLMELQKVASTLRRTCGEWLGTARSRVFLARADL